MIVDLLASLAGSMLVTGALTPFPDLTVGQVVQLIVGLALLAWACPLIQDPE